jgi:hypothetical protein
MNASATANAFVPLTFAPGEAYQFDSHGDVWVKTDSKSLLRLFGIQGLSQICMDAARVRRRFKSHTVAAIDGCTNIPRAAVMAQENETILELGIGAKSNFGSSTWTRQDLLALEDYKIRFTADLALEMARQGAAIPRAEFVEPLSTIATEGLVPRYALGEQQSFDPVDVQDALISQHLALTA